MVCGRGSLHECQKGNPMLCATEHGRFAAAWHAWRFASGPDRDSGVADAREDSRMVDLRKGLVTRCPNEHAIEPIFDVCTLRDSLDRKHVQVYCFTCGKSWTLSPA